jgi:hypothetical protein
MKNKLVHLARKSLLMGFVLTSTFHYADLQGEEAVAIGTRLELFVDQYLIDTMDNVEFRLHQPQETPLPESFPNGFYMTIILDDGLYRAYYRDRDSTYPGPYFSGDPGEIIRYAESTDGIEWSFPKLGLFEVEGSYDNNVVLANAPPFTHNLSPFLDTRPDVDPDQRYKALAGHPGRDRETRSEGMYAFVSPDGIVWEKMSEEEVIPYNKDWGHAFDSQNVAFWSEEEQQYVCYFRTWDTSHGRLRTVSRTTSPDFINWSEPVAMDPNVPGEHLYTSQTQPYFRAPHIYIALPSRYVAGRVGAESTHGMQGSTDILFMAKRAGDNPYERLFTEAFISPGMNPARWENRANYVAQNVVPTGDNEMSIYHQRGYRYVLRTDGFISIRAGAVEGELLTNPIIFEGDQLVLNYSTSAAGSLRVEIQHANGTPIPGFELENSMIAVGDTIDGVMAWKGDPNLAEWAGTPVRLRFVMTECDVYSFRFDSASAEKE